MPKIDTRALGLDVGLTAVKFLTGEENLHYGYWSGLDVIAANVGAAQNAYTQKLFEFLPDREKLSILDIGGGAGVTAQKLVSRGHSVEIVVPSAALAARCRANCDASVTINQCRFEEFETDKRYDICLFSESFQYIPMAYSLRRVQDLLKEGGAIVIGDCFRTERYGQGNLPTRVGGGFPYKRYEGLIGEYGLITEALEDVTEAVAPSVEIEQAFFNVIGYALERVEEELSSKKPFLHRSLGFLTHMILGRRRKDKLRARLNGSARNRENFKELNKYIMTRLSLPPSP